MHLRSSCNRCSSTDDDDGGNYRFLCPFCQAVSPICYGGHIRCSFRQFSAFAALYSYVTAVFQLLCEFLNDLRSEPQSKFYLVYLEHTIVTF